MEENKIERDLNQYLKERKIIKDIGSKKMKRKKFQRVLKMSLFILLLFLFSMYILLAAFYSSGDFIIALDQNFAKKTGIIIYENEETRESRRILNVQKLDFMDNIAEEWIASDVHIAGGGSNNGDNYISYTYFVENQGSDVVNYWSHLFIDDVIKNVDEAVRIKVYINDEEPKTYAKIARDGNPEPGTIPFYSDEYVFVEPRNQIGPGQRDRVTLVIWIHGPDPECLDHIIGGEMKMHMEITEEQLGEGSILPEWSLNTKLETN